MRTSPAQLLFRYDCFILIATTVLMHVGISPKTFAQDSEQAPKILVNFGAVSAIDLQQERSKAEIVKRGDNHALQIDSSEGDWPGVLIQTAKAGPWDLSGFDQVEMDIHDTQDVPLRVLLSVNNPRADGRRNCNTAAVHVPAKGNATLVLPFGSWHGDPGHPIDLANVVSVRVFLDQPRRPHRFFVDDIRATVYDRGHMQKVFADPFFNKLQPPFGRGVNLGNALEAPREGEWGVTLEASYFEAIASAGFDSVRIPIRWSAHAEASAPYRIDPKFFERVDWAVRQSLDRKLRPIINMHHYTGIMERPNEHRERFLALWQQIAEHYREFTPEVAFEILNEPQQNLDAAKWNELLAATLAVVRRTNPTREIVVGPANFNGIDHLEQLKLPADDRHLIVTVHYYSPFSFTHQGAHWLTGDSRPPVGKKWTGTPAEKLAIVRDFDKAIAWAVEHRRPLYLGEFGAYEKADLASRARWTKFVADEANQRKIGWGYWEFCSNFNAYDAKSGKWIAPLKDALLPEE